MKKNNITIVQLGLKKYFFQDLYYRVLKMTWLNFILIAALFYVLLNFVFALIYFLSPAEILNARPDSLWDSFIFSFQTSSTLGYGYMIPTTDIAHAIVVFDTMMGIFYAAIITGLAFSKFSRPEAKVMFSNNIILTTFDNIPTLMFRIANSRDTHIVDASLNVAALIPYISKEGHEMRRFFKLPLVSNDNPTFSLTWTAMHQLTKESPLYGMSLEQIVEKKVLIFVSLTGIDDILSQSIHSNHRYRTDSLIRAKKFVDIIIPNEDPNKYVIDFEKFHEISL